MNDELTIFEADELESCENVIEHGWRIAFAVGNALKTIRDKRLYRAEYPTWEAYTTERWGHLFEDKGTADRWINAAEVQQNLLPIGVTLEHENQAREIAQLAPDIQRGVITVALEVVAMEGAKKMTASHIRHTVNAIMDTDPAELQNGHAVQVIAQNVVESRKQSKSTYIERSQGDKPTYAELLTALECAEYTINRLVSGMAVEIDEGLSVLHQIRDVVGRAGGKLS